MLLPTPTHFPSPAPSSSPLCYLLSSLGSLSPSVSSRSVHTHTLPKHRGPGFFPSSHRPDHLSALKTLATENSRAVQDWAAITTIRYTPTPTLRDTETHTRETDRDTVHSNRLTVLHAPAQAWMAPHTPTPSRSDTNTVPGAHTATHAENTHPPTFTHSSRRASLSLPCQLGETPGPACPLPPAAPSCV